MAQLLNTSVNGALSVTGNVTSATAPTDEHHLVNKKYTDEVGKVWAKQFTIANESTYRSVTAWHNPCSDSLSCTLTKGTYILTGTFTITSKGSGGCVIRICNGSSEFLGEYARCNGFFVTDGWYPSLNLAVIFEVSSTTTYNFHPEINGTVPWRPRGCEIRIAKISPG